MTRELAKAGLWHTGARNVDGRTLGEIAADARETPGQEVIPAGGGPAVPDRGPGDGKSNLAPEGSVVKLAGHERRLHVGPARVFDSEEDARAVKRRLIRPGDVVVIRYEGPAGGPGMREMLHVTRCHRRRGHRRRGGPDHRRPSRARPTG